MVTSVQSVRRNTKTEKYPSTKNKTNKGLCKTFRQVMSIVLSAASIHSC